MNLVLWWIRRDLRLTDNQALQTALLGERSVIPVFILDPHLLSAPASKRQAFLFAGLQALDQHLRSLGSRLIIRQGKPVEELARLVAESGATTIFSEEDYSPYARRRDAEVAGCLPLELIAGLTVHHPAAVVKANGKPYTVFSAFRRSWKSLPFTVQPASSQLYFQPVPALGSLPIPESPPIPGFPAGEDQAVLRLDAFLDGPVYSYPTDRNRMDLEGTSALSPYLRFGMLSARQAAWATSSSAIRSLDSGMQAGCETWLNELVWREFYQSILYHFPQVLCQAFNPRLRQVAWNSDPARLKAWQEGRTGYPIVDASQRQPSSLGWMHNRGRMISASFLVKDLLLNWQAGERWFMRHLLDGDPASNNGGWQWTAGVGTDAAPYFRIFNPVSQSQKCDPQGRFIRRWIPELARVPVDFIHQPWLMPTELQRIAGCRIGVDYPAPVVNHASAKAQALMAFKSAYQSTKSELL